MDNSDGVKQKPNQSTETSLEASKNTPSAKNLLVKHSWLLFVGLFGISVGVSIFGYYQLSYIGDVPKKEAENPLKLVSAELITRFADTSNATPSWLIIAIALTCATGCWVIFRLLKLP